MAKIGEGDKRWIVKERDDGKNVNHWHWTEKDCMEWSRRRLRELLENVKVLEGEGGCWCNITEVKSVEGEAYVNIRKKKIIPGYELKVHIGWSGEVKDSSGQSVGSASGKVEVPYLADENAEEEADLRVTVEGEGPEKERLRAAMVSRGRPIIQERLKQFVKEMMEGGAAKEEIVKIREALDAKGGSTSPPSVNNPGSGRGGQQQQDMMMAKATPASSTAAKAAPTSAAKKDKDGTKTVTLTESFHCRAADVYSLLMDENRWRAITASNAKVATAVGGAFSLFDGAVTGVHQELVENKLIVQKWRKSDWEDGHYSTVCMTFEEPEVGRTVLRLTQSNVPIEDRFGNATVVENTERGWKDFIFQKIRNMFGYGL